MRKFLLGAISASLLTGMASGLPVAATEMNQVEVRQEVEGTVLVDALSFPDPVFRNKVVALLGVMPGQAVSADTLNAVKTLDVSNSGIQSLKGIELFAKLTTLNCDDNQLTALDISQNTQLKNLSCQSNQLSELNVNNNLELETLNCHNNQIRVLNLSNNMCLETVDFWGNYIVDPLYPNSWNRSDVTLMFRLYNPASGEHFYTANKEEKEFLEASGWTGEGVGWMAPQESKVPVYRLYNPNSGDHHYTMNPEEKDALVTIGWNDEGIGWYSDENEQIPLYRQFNPNAETGSHNYTTLHEEHLALIRMGWNDEGIAWYAKK